MSYSAFDSRRNSGLKRMFALRFRARIDCVTVSLTEERLVPSSRHIPILADKSFDEMDFDSIGKELTAIFLIIPAARNTYKAVSNIFYSQLFERLMRITLGFTGKIKSR